MGLGGSDGEPNDGKDCHADPERKCEEQDTEPGFFDDAGPAATCDIQKRQGYGELHEPAE